MSEPHFQYDKKPREPPEKDAVVPPPPDYPPSPPKQPAPPPMVSDKPDRFTCQTCVKPSPPKKN